MELHFLRPYWFFAIIPLSYLCWCLSRQNIVNNWHKICDSHLLKELLVKPTHQINLPIFLLFFGSLLAIVALAGPSWHQETQPIYRVSQGTILVLNLTPSMSENIGTSTKIDRARFKMLDYLNNQKEGLSGLVVYTDEAHVISPLTEDNHTIANFVPSLDPSIMPTFNDDTAVALKEADKLFKQAGINSGNIVLFTDKISNSSKTIQIAKSLASDGYRLNILSISDASNHASLLEEVAQAGGGKVIPLAPNNKDINQLLAQTKIKTWSNIKRSDEKGRFWHDDGRWLVLLLLPLAILAFRRGYL